jgi:hypothetical protein
MLFVFSVSEDTRVFLGAQMKHNKNSKKVSEIGVCIVSPSRNILLSHQHHRGITDCSNNTMQQFHQPAHPSSILID